MAFPLLSLKSSPSYCWHSPAISAAISKQHKGHIRARCPLKMHGKPERLKKIHNQGPGRGRPGKVFNKTELHHMDLMSDESLGA